MILRRPCRRYPLCWDRLHSQGATPQCLRDPGRKQRTAPSRALTASRAPSRVVCQNAAISAALFWGFSETTACCGASSWTVLHIATKEDNEHSCRIKTTRRLDRETIGELRHRVNLAFQPFYWPMFPSVSDSHLIPFTEPSIFAVILDFSKTLPLETIRSAKPDAPLVLLKPISA